MGGGGGTAKNGVGARKKMGWVIPPPPPFRAAVRRANHYTTGTMIESSKLLDNPVEPQPLSCSVSATFHFGTLACCADSQADWLSTLPLNLHLFALPAPPGSIPVSWRTLSASPPGD